MERLEELLGLLADFTDVTGEQLGQIRAELVTMAADESLDNDMLARIADGVSAIDTESTRRAEEAARRTDLLSRLNTPAPVTETPAPEVTPDPEPEPEPEVEEEEEETPQAVVPVAAALSPRNPPRRLTITAGAELPNHNVGAEMSVEDLAEATIQRARSLIRAGRGVTGRWNIATVHADYPEDRRVDQSNMSAVINEFFHPERRNTREALVATGGLCAPVNVSYDLYQISSDARPVRDALPRFNATRGGIQFITPPQMSDTDAAVTTVTEAQDEAGSVTKACVEITCGELTTVEVQAIALCIQRSNWSRFFPEQFPVWWANGLASHARVAERELLDGIAAASTAVSDGATLGAARDVFESHVRAAVAYRSRHRIAPTSPLTVLVPAWLPAMFAVDLHRQGPGDSTYATAAAVFESWYRNFNLDLVYYWDEETNSNEVWNAQTAGFLNAWPTNFRSYMFAPGTFLFLDGGTLDLGLEIRDSSLNTDNRVQAFMEVWEAVAFTGIESLRITHNNVCPSGEASALIDFTCIGS